MAFSEGVIKQAWERANGHCESCGKKLSFGSRREGEWGAWEAHHKTAVQSGGTDTLSNCKILCLDCHKKTASYGRHS